MEKRNIYAGPVTGFCKLQSGLCQFAVGSDADPDDAWAPGRKKVSFKPENAGQ